MKYCMITFRSVTFAQRAEGVLQRMGYFCTVRRTPKWMEEQGCGYSLRLRQEDIMAAALLLRENGISYRKVYEMTGEGQLEELRL